MNPARDTSFARDARPLADWLMDVVGSDPAAREKALDVVQAMQMGIASIETDLGEIDEDEIARHRVRFREEVERAVSTPAFPGADFIRALAALIQGKHAEWMRQNKLAGGGFDTI